MEHKTSGHYQKNKQLGLFRKAGTLDRASYLVRARELAPRGMELPQTILTPDDVRRARAMKAKREKLRAMITARYSNAALAEIFGVSVRCIERALARETHVDVV